MKRAIISDIHSNLEALEAVLKDIDEQNISEIYCLGDIIGYGANPLECLDIVRERCAVCILGNHDQGAIFDPDGFNGMAEKAIFWTREQLEKPSPKRDDRWDFLNMRPRIYRDSSLSAIFVHGSPRNPLNEYVFPDDVYSPNKLKGVFGLTQTLAFLGHSHVPGIMVEPLSEDEQYNFFSPDEFGMEKLLTPKKKYLINVGSVGQPRDMNPKACYVIVEANGEPEEQEVVVRYRRVQYDIERAQKKIFEIPALENQLAERLSFGR
ncbi:MAG: metallophosphoesterase family protein [Planctomycetia bacterium]|nr:metallophosphoesterase family protein [Planctomycetia bacterium]